MFNPSCGGGEASGAPMRLLRSRAVAALAESGPYESADAARPRYGAGTTVMVEVRVKNSAAARPCSRGPKLDWPSPPNGA